MTRLDAHLRRIRLLALTAPTLEAALPELFGSLSQVVGSTFMGMFWHDPAFRVTDLMTRDPISTDLILDFYLDFLPHEEKWRMTGFHPRDLYRFDKAFQASRSPGFDRRAFQHSEFHDRVLRHIQFGLAAGINFRHADGSPMGGIALGRELRGPDFAARELAVLAQVQPWLEHVARRRDGGAPRDEPMLPRSSSVLLLDEGGNTLSHSDAALQHLHELQGHGYRLGRLQVPRRELQVEAVGAVHADVLLGLQCRSVAPPRRVVDNHWGRFVLRGYALRGAQQHQVLVQIDKYAPLSVMVFNSLHFQRLTDREKVVVLGILASRTIRAMAESMGVRESTVVYFMRQIYTKLEVRDQAGLRALLMQDLAAPQEGPGVPPVH